MVNFDITASVLIVTVFIALFYIFTLLFGDINPAHFWGIVIFGALMGIELQLTGLKLVD